jgi:hypothetical protein
MQSTKGKQLKIYKIFYDDEVIQKCSDYEIVFSETAPYPYYNRLANYTADNCSTTYIASVLESVEKYLTENLNDINGLFIKLDIEAVILSAVLTKLNRDHELVVKFPLFESVFLCNHKYYQRKQEQNPIQFSYVDIDDDDNKLNWDKMPRFPLFFKAVELQMSVHQYTVEDSEQLKQIIKRLRIELPNYNVDTKYVNAHHLNLQNYPLATKNIMICEELISNCLQLNWEGWADDQGNIFTYGFTDEILADQGIFSDFIMPSIMPKVVLEQAENICMQFLKCIAFKSSFANIELWVKKTDYSDIHIIEVNPRSAFSYHDQYQTSYHGANLYNSIIQLSMGKKDIGIIPDPHVNFTGLYSCQSVFATRFNGKISQLLNFDKIEQEKEINKDYRFFYLFQDREFEIVDNYQSGARVLMRVFFTKPTYEQAQNESLRLKKLFLIKDTYYM